MLGNEKPHETRRRFLELLAQEETESVYQAFLEKHTQLIPRQYEQNHGVHGNLVIRKMPISSDYCTDFLFVSKCSAYWNCVLIEIEKPQSKFFKEGTLDFHKDFLDATKQILRWRAWFSIDENKDCFVRGTLGSLLGGDHPMAKNPCKIKYVLVMGRREEIGSDPQRRALLRESQKDGFKIVSYDGLVENLEHRNELYLVVRKNEFYEIHSEKYLGEGPFLCLSPHLLRIKETLRDDALKHRDEWRSYDDFKTLRLANVLPKIKTFG